MLSRKPVWSALLVAALGFGSATLGTLSAAAHDRDDDRGHSRECSLRTVHGRYGFFAQGTVLAVPSGPSAHPAFPFVVSGTFDYDGEGNVSGKYNQSLAGGTSTGLPAEGTYQVTPDCTYSATLTTPAGVVHRAGTITGEGMRQEIHIIFTDPSSVAFGTLKKTPQGECSLETLKGDYALFGQGTILPLTASIARATAGVLTFDGEGNFSGQATGNTGGAVSEGDFTGKYTVTPECEVLAGIDVTTGPNAGKHFDEMGSVTGEGESKEIHDIFTTPGWVFTDTLKK